MIFVISLIVCCISSVGHDDCNKPPPNGSDDVDSARSNAFGNDVGGVNDRDIPNVAFNCCRGSFIAVLLLFAIDVL